MKARLTLTGLTDVTSCLCLLVCCGCNILEFPSYEKVMPLAFKQKQLQSLEDIQNLKGSELKEILRSNSKKCSVVKANLVLKVYAIVMKTVLPRVNTRNDASQSSFQHDYTFERAMKEIGLTTWSQDLRKLPKMSLIQLYDYLVVKMSKYHNIVLKGTNFKKLISCQFFFEGHIQRIEIA